MAVPTQHRFSVACAAFAAAAIAGCGAAATQPLGSSNAARLRRDIAGIRSAVADRSRGAALARISALEGEIGKLTANGQLARSDAAVLRLDATRLHATVSSQLQVRDPLTATRSTQVSTTSETTARSTTQTTASPASQQGQQGAGHGAAHGPSAHPGAGHGPPAHPGAGQGPSAKPGAHHGPGGSGHTPPGHDPAGHQHPGGNHAPGGQQSQGGQQPPGAQQGAPQTTQGAIEQLIEVGAIRQRLHRWEYLRRLLQAIGHGAGNGGD